jgi:RNA polymerase sigma-70 factor (ECF subfamily)
MLASGNIPRRSSNDEAAHRAILEELEEVATGNLASTRG